MTQPDAVMTQIGHAVELGQRGERQAARRQLAELWDQIGRAGDPLHRVALAHGMADLQDDPHDELAWDLRALQAADERAAQAGVPGPVAMLYPSLHLNLGEDYRKIGDMAAARHHLELGETAAEVLGDDGYSRMIKGGLQELGGRLAD